jgi:hypothetical protein
MPSDDAACGLLGPGFERFPLVEAIHQAGCMISTDEVARWRAPYSGTASRASRSVPAGVAPDSAGSLIRRRGSARRFDPGRSISLAQFNWLCELMLAPPAGDGRPPQTRLLVHAVEGVAPGLYRTPPDQPVGQVDRRMSRQLCLDQQLGHDAAFLACFVAAEDRKADPRAYRVELLGAGLALGQLYLGAEALGLGCTGLTMVDSLLPDLLHEPVDGLAIAAVGIRPYRARIGGRPGRPNALRCP